MKFKVFCTLIIGLFLIVFTVNAQEDSESILGRVSYIEGIAGLDRGLATIGASVFEKSELLTQKGRVEVELEDGCIRINQYTKVVFLQKESMLVDYGEIYIEARVPIEVRTPHEVFPAEGIYRVEVDRYKTRKYPNLRLVDDFDKWTYSRQKEINHPVVADYRADYREDYNDWRYFSPYWYPYWGGINWYVGWYPYYWANWYGWYPVWSYYGYYPYYDYYSRYYYNDPYHGRTPTTIRKDQLQKRNSNSSVNSSRTTSRNYPSRISKSSISSPSSRISSSPSRSTLSRSSISRSPRISAPSASISFRSSPPRSSSGSASRGAIRKK